jgi:IS4 transposase
MTASRNGNGYDISSQNYFRELGKLLEIEIDPVRKQSISDARAKIYWQAFEFLLTQSNLESAGLPDEFKFEGHVTRAWDGTSFITARTEELLTHFTPRKTKSEEGETHYPYGLCLTAINVFTGQPTHAVVDDYKQSERSLLKQIIKKCSPGDLALLDRGLGGAQVYLEFRKNKQYFIHRAKTTGTRIAKYITKFLSSGSKEKTLKISVKDAETEKLTRVKIRLILGPTDSEGKAIVFVTNLIDQKKYKIKKIIALYQRRWSVETLYNRVKNLLCLENFHAKSYNGVMQEIFACLLILSITAAAVSATVEEDEINPNKQLPNFKNAVESIRRNLFSVIDGKITGLSSKKLMKTLLEEIRSVMYRIRPGRSYARVSQQPIQSWNLKKSAKIKAFQEQRRP